VLFDLSGLRWNGSRDRDGGGQMTQRVAFVVQGNPIPKARPRVVLREGQRPRAYTPRQTKAYEAEVAWAAKQAMRGRTPFAGPVGMTLKFYRATRARADGDNLEKAIADAMNGLVYLDDDQVVECHRYKRLDRQWPRVEVEVWEVEEVG
jgi:Holliday junction resolvase RusA-like endonuclease